MGFYLFGISIYYTTVKKEILMIMTMVWKNKSFNLLYKEIHAHRYDYCKFPSFYTSQIHSQSMGVHLREE